MQSRREPDGFTIIELMTAVVVLTILVMIGVPQFVSRVEKAKEAQTLTNMRLLAVMLETYRTDWTEYPVNLSELAAGAEAKGYNKSASNPVSGQMGKLGSPNVWAIDFVNPGPPGFAGYEYVGKTQFRLYGYDKDGMPIKRNGTIYKMSNG